jgi:hypothetical protein
MARPKNKNADNKSVITNLRTTEAWREEAHRKARKRGLTLSEYVRQLVDGDLA